MSKFYSLFGNISTLDQLLKDFYSVLQAPTESVASWGCRIEDLMMKVREKDVLALPVREEMLRIQFWAGLYNANIKAATRHKFD